MLTPGQIGLARALNQTSMTDSFRATREGEKVWNDERKQYDRPVVTVYDGPGKVERVAGERVVDEQGRLVTVQRLVLTLPADVLAPPIGTTFERTASLDASTIGARFTIAGGDPTTAAAGRQFPVTHDS